MFCSPAESMCHVVMVLDFCALKAQNGRRKNSRKKFGLGSISPHVHVQGVLILLELKCRGEVFGLMATTTKCKYLSDNVGFKLRHCVVLA